MEYIYHSIDQGYIFIVMAAYAAKPINHNPKLQAHVVLQVKNHSANRWRCPLRAHVDKVKDPQHKLPVWEIVGTCALFLRIRCITCVHTEERYYYKTPELRRLQEEHSFGSLGHSLYGPVSGRSIPSLRCTGLGRAGCLINQGCSMSIPQVESWKEYRFLLYINPLGVCVDCICKRIHIECLQEPYVYNPSIQLSWKEHCVDLQTS